MDRRTTLVTAGVTALVMVTATAAVAVNTGLLSVPSDDVAGSLELPASETAVVDLPTDAPTEPTDIETVYVDVYDQPADPADQEVVVVPVEPRGTAATAPGDASVTPDRSAASATDDGYDDDEYDEYDDDEYDDDEDEDEHEEEDEHDEHEEEDEHEEYEGRDDDD